jgi:hypothetical protein
MLFYHINPYIKKLFFLDLSAGKVYKLDVVHSILQEIDMKKHFVVIVLLLLASVVVLAVGEEEYEMKKNAKLKREAELQAEREAEQKYGTRTTTNTVYQPYAVPYAVPTGSLETKIEKNGYFDFLDNEYHKAEIKRLEKKIESLEKKVETLPLQRQLNSFALRIQNLQEENQKLTRQILWLRKIVRDAGLEQKGAPNEVQEANDEPNNLDPNTQDSNSVR